VSAYRSLRRNTPYTNATQGIYLSLFMAYLTCVTRLFTYKKYPDLGLPFGYKIDNTTNAIDGGVFSQGINLRRYGGWLYHHHTSPMKKLMNIHNGFSKSLKLKIVDFYLVNYHK